MFYIFTLIYLNAIILCGYLEFNLPFFIEPYESFTIMIVNNTPNHSRLFQVLFISLNQLHCTKFIKNIKQLYMMLINWNEYII